MVAHMVTESMKYAVFTAMFKGRGMKAVYSLKTTVRMFTMMPASESHSDVQNRRRRDVSVCCLSRKNSMITTTRVSARYSDSKDHSTMAPPFVGNQRYLLTVTS